MTSSVNDIQAVDIQLLESMLDTMTDHVFIFRCEGSRHKLVYCNRAVARFIGRDSDALCGDYLDEIIPDPAVCQRISENYDRAIQTGTLLRYEEDTEGFSDPVTVFETTLSPLFAKDGSTIFICGISRDITARRKAENALKETNTRLQQQLSENHRLQRKLKEEAIRDPLTNLFNRRYFIECFQRELSRVRRGKFALTLMMLDLDYFKQLNDRYGHSIGDQVLVEFSRRLSATMRTEDIVARWGGEEFLVMMPGLTLEDARLRIHEWRKHHSPMEVRCADETITVTCSIGLATAPDHGLDADRLINITDDALYKAKSAGRNRIEIAGLNGLV